ncbi:MAG TPA: RNB domain-containing ribonuclease [Chthonomonadaceae bacterium]|nr:RNB domain-containing ribonuclease [Chthonomonadaceae bacterium]
MSHEGHPQPHIDLRRRARIEMERDGFEPEFSPEALREADDAAGQPASGAGIRDLRDLPWSSIDNRESRDLDQIEVVERLSDDSIRLRVGIADVGACVPVGSPIDAHASRNGCSVYTGVAVFPLLPEPLSTDRTSLLQSSDREAVVIELDIDRDGGTSSPAIYRALTRNRAQLDYATVGAWLDGHGPVPDRIAQAAGMEEQLRLQHEVAQRLLDRRRGDGALEFETVEPKPVIEGDRVADLRVEEKNRARQIIENFMIAANMAMAAYLESRSIPAIQRVVREPQRWPRIVEIAARYGVALPDAPDSLALSRFLTARRAADPERFPDLSLAVVKLMGPGEYTVVRSAADRSGHFGLAVYSYTHSTAPNRRFADMVVQRAIKAAIAGSAAPYADSALEAIARHCAERENAARKVERFMRKACAASWMQERIGQTFAAIVTGASPKGTYVRLSAPPVEGRVVRGFEGLDVGDHTRVRLIGADPDRGFIDFEEVS